MKLKVHIDSKGYKQKPTSKEVGGIKTRLQKDASPSLVILVDYGYLKEKRYSAPTGGRPRANGYLLNPIFFDRISER